VRASRGQADGELDLRPLNGATPARSHHRNFYLRALRAAATLCFVAANNGWRFY
jgi:hypothetical protein